MWAGRTGGATPTRWQGQPWTRDRSWVEVGVCLGSGSIREAASSGTTDLSLVPAQPLRAAAERFFNSHLQIRS